MTTEQRSSCTIPVVVVVFIVLLSGLHISVVISRPRNMHEVSPSLNTFAKRK